MSSRKFTDPDRLRAGAAYALDAWVVGGNGSETPFVKNGRTYLYVWNAALMQHGFLDMGTDIVINDMEFYAEDIK